MKRTQIAQQGIDFVTLFHAKFTSTNVNGFRPLLREPTESTAGGKQAMQHMVLMPSSDGDPTLTIGSVNVAVRTAKLRTFDCLLKLHRMRFGTQPLQLDQASYQTFFDGVLKFMKLQGMYVDVVTNPPQVEGGSHFPPAVTSSSSQLVQWIALFLLLAGIGAFAYLLYSGAIVL
ncbi:MAG: hypothetical protein JRI68_34855 [Deltaproteobacteria bacterium]|nr:hypothetical protein [Deltaproteobacteria bacterium]